jgi:hypothetical protein
MANACAQKPQPLPDGGQPSVMDHHTVMRDAYAKMTDSGCGLLQHFVSTLRAKIALQSRRSWATVHTIVRCSRQFPFPFHSNICGYQRKIIFIT